MELSNVLLLLPNRRACQTMANAFIRQQGMAPTLLPQMRPLGDVDEDEVYFGYNAANIIEKDLLPAISPLERTLLFMRIILSRPQEFGAEKISLYQACSLAQELGHLIDTAQLEDLDFSNLAHLVPEEYATHWQETLKFLEIITKNWPLILAERGVVDSSQHKKEALLKQALLWEQTQPQKHIIIAASTATYPSMQKLAKTIYLLPKGEIILYGLDKLLDTNAWKAIDESHPQFELKKLLEYLEIERNDIPDIIAPKNLARERFISEIMRPAAQTDSWRNLHSMQQDEINSDGIHLINCADIREEAANIALIMRHTLETPEKTATLITPDRNLARRVSSELKRWNINVDDTAGVPLSLTSWGIFMRLIISASQPEASKETTLSLLKHPLCGLKLTPQEVLFQTRHLEKNIWRSDAPQSDENTLLENLQKYLTPLTELYNQPNASLNQLLQTHIRIAETLATTASIDGDKILWKGEAGNSGANFINKILSCANILPEIDPKEYLGLFESLCSQISVRSRYGTHPRLKIMGPIEARLTLSDITIIGSFNEGIWPQSTTADPWMSRPMKKDFGFPLPEKSIGILGLDLSCFMGAKEIFITRSEKVDGTPTLKSRWLMRLETVLHALNIPLSSLDCPAYQYTAKNIDEPDSFSKVSAPTPRPPLNYRPRQLSASGIELLMRDPYSVFAKYILKLKPLKDLSQEPTLADFGSIIHKILEEFNNKYSQEFPSDSLEQLLKIGKEIFFSDPKLKNKKSFWWPKFSKMIEHLSLLEKEYRPTIQKIHNEVEGSLTISDLPNGEFTITAKADRIDETKDGKINIIDYKTGKSRSVKEVSLGFAPQLPIEGLIAQSGGFKGIKAKEVNQLIYWQLGRKDIVIEDKISQILSDNKQNIKELLNIFDFETTPYTCNPNPKRVPEYSDYEHLARIKEWYINEDEDD